MTKEERKGNLKIAVKDFGPISSGSVDLKPLTVFIGPNNSGKSYFAMLVNSIFTSLDSLEAQKLRFHSNRDIELIFEEFPGIKKEISDSKYGDEIEIPRDFIERMIQIIFKDIFEKQLNNELVRSYSCQLRELTRDYKRSFSVILYFHTLKILLSLAKGNLKINEYPKLSLHIKVKREVDFFTAFGGEPVGIDRISLSVSTSDRRRFVNGVESVLLTCMEFIFEHIKNALGIRRNFSCNYLPAARSGILTGHKALVSNIVRKASYVGIDKFDIPKFSGAVSDLLSSLIELTDEEGPLFGFTREFEHELIGGEVVISTISDYTAPDIKYRFKDKEISMHQSSSTVKELAPLFLYLKYKVAPGSLLIIEEPEAHLHPENQRILAKLLVRLIRKGVKLFITTHSDYLLDQLSSFIMLSRTKSKKQREELNYDKDDYLKPDEIGVHVFQFDKKSKGYKIEEVEISAEDGISQEEFLKVNEALYEESIKIREKIEERKG